MEIVAMDMKVHYYSYYIIIIIVIIMIISENNNVKNYWTGILVHLHCKLMF